MLKENPALCSLGNEVRAWFMCKCEVLKPADVQICNTLTVNFINILADNMQMHNSQCTVHTQKQPKRRRSSIACYFVLNHNFFAFHSVNAARPSFLHFDVILLVVIAPGFSSIIYIQNSFPSIQVKLVSISWSNRNGFFTLMHLISMLQIGISFYEIQINLERRTFKSLTDRGKTMHIGYHFTAG